MPYPLLAKAKGAKKPEAAAPVSRFISSPAASGINSKNIKKTTIAVIELSDGKTKSDSISKVADTVRDEFALNEKFQVLTKQATQDFFKNNSAQLQQGKSAPQLNRYLDEAKEFYKNFEFKDATKVLESTIATYRQSKTPPNEPFALTDAYLTLGNVSLGANNEKKATEAFQEAVRLDPDRQITEAEYPPRTVKLYTEVKQAMLKKSQFGALEISSSPSKADVYVNGVLKGQTPLKLARYTAGEHFIQVKEDKYNPVTLKVRLDAKGVREKVDLDKSSSQNAATTTGIILPNLGNVPEQVRLASIAGKSLSVDKVILVNVQEVGWNNRISARMVDIKYQASHKPKVVDVLDLPKDTRSAANVIVQDAVQIAGYDLAKNPKKYADSEVVVIGEKKKRSMLKSPLLWSLIGVVVAGGAASALLLGGGDGNNSGVGFDGTFKGAASK